MILRKAIPACAESFCVRACCDAPQRQLDLRTRCFAKIITICMGVACDKKKNIPELALRLRLCLFIFFHQDLRGFCFYLNPNLVNTVPAHSFTRKPTTCRAGRGVRSHHPPLKLKGPRVQTVARHAARPSYKPRASPDLFGALPTASPCRPRGDGSSAQLPLPSLS